MYKNTFSSQLFQILVVLLIFGFHSVQNQQIHSQIQTSTYLVKDHNNLKEHPNSQVLIERGFDRNVMKDEIIVVQQIPDEKNNNEQISDYSSRIQLKQQQQKQRQENQRQQNQRQQNQRQLDKRQQNQQEYSITCKIDGCSSCNEYDINVCNYCEDKYVLDLGKCYKPDEYPINCTLAQKKGTPLRYHCSTCFNGFALNSSEGTCRECKISECSLCSIDTLDVCESCIDGYFVLDKSCQKCTDNCMYCTSSADCYQCVSGYILSGQYCSKCSVNNCQNCTEYQSGDTCSKCYSGYFLSANQCLNATIQQNGTVSYGSYSFKCPTGCNKCVINASNFVCSQCQQGYGLNATSNQCNKCQQLCRSCDGIVSDQCTDCYPGYVLSNYSCSQCLVQFCTQCDPSNITQCLKCADNYYLHSSGLCYLCNDGCRQCDETGNCSYCLYGYHLFGYDNGSVVCQSCISGCGDCEPWNGKCTECFPRFYLSEQSVCVMCENGCWKCNSSSVCVQCEESKVLVNSKCVDAVQNCISLDSKGVCGECLVGYVLNQTVNECAYSYSSSLIASLSYSCPSDSYLLNSKCYKCTTTITNCLSCQYNYCLKCKDTFYLSDSKLACLPCSIDNCITCTNYNVCSSCADGYYMQTDVLKFYLRPTFNQQDLITSYGKCLICSQNCLTCQYRDNICITCKSGYYLTNSRNCLTLNKFDFQIKINADFTTFASRIDDLKAQFVYLIQDDSNVSLCMRKKFIHLTALSSGSVNVVGYVSASSPQNLQKTYDNFNTFSSGGSLNNGFSIISSKLSNYQTAPTVDNSSTNNSTIIPAQSSTNIVPIVIGVVAGVIVLIVVIVIIVCCFCCKNKGEQVGEMSEDKKSSSTGEERESNKKDEKDFNPESQKYFNNPSGQKQQNWVSPQYYL